MEKVLQLVRRGEGENVEFKEFLTSYHLREGRFRQLACQMNHRIIMGKGKAIYVVGVSDSGQIRGIEEEKFKETIDVLKRLAEEVEAEISSVERYSVNGGVVGVVEIRKANAKEHILVGTAGHVDHGKSTLVGCLITGKPDDGDGATRVYLDVLKHEIERGLSAEINFAVFGYKNGNVMRLKNPMNKGEKALVVENADKLVSFVDTVGHEPWLRTTIRGLLGQKIDYGLLVVAADDGVMRTTKEHLGIMLAMDLPVIVAITKADMVSAEGLEEVVQEVSSTLRMVGRVPMLVKSENDAKKASELLAENRLVVPIIVTSAITLEGYDILEKMFLHLPKRYTAERDFLMYIDKIYRVTGVGTVVSGSVKSGELREGEEVYIGPFENGGFRKVKVQSIEMHHYRIDRAKSGDIIGAALKGVRYDELRRGMVLSRNELNAVWEFEADVYVFTHPTLISVGYEPVMHVETISETVTFVEMDREYLKSGDRGKVRMKFKYHPQYVYEGQKFIFREGRSKGMGEITKIFV
ncbi:MULTISPECIES: GTPBP1 family GTP-binding protein [unclassified Archaeoglobus]|uniref:GTPBP1 family GTP-binding protein n=1 Tax=unclassified Archaeoglobus TaxID=2643606 RepID=UPI0025C13677|nr:MULTISPECIES: GTPBP1 family GTP-binding protein [unclassified Archaeoglobus]